MGMIASQITSVSIVYSTVCSGTDQRKLQSSASLAFVRGIHRDQWIPRTKGQCPSAAYVRQWIGPVLVQIMACCLLAPILLMPSHYLNDCWVIVNWTLRNNLQWNFDQNTKLSIHENASENIVCEMAAVLSKEWSVKWCNGDMLYRSQKHKHLTTNFYWMIF